MNIWFPFSGGWDGAKYALADGLYSLGWERMLKNCGGSQISTQGLPNGLQSCSTSASNILEPSLNTC